MHQVEIVIVYSTMVSSKNFDMTLNLKYIESHAWSSWSSLLSYELSFDCIEFNNYSVNIVLL